MKKRPETIWSGIPPWIILGLVIVLVPIFFFWTLQNINKQKENMAFLLSEKGAALIRSFEAGTRTGMMGMMGMRAGGFQLQKLLTETAQQPDILYLIVTDTAGVILAHSDPSRIGGVYGADLDLDRVSRTEGIMWRRAQNPGSPPTFEVFRRFRPTHIPHRGGRWMMHPGWHTESPGPEKEGGDPKQIIFVGMDMSALEAARKEDMRHTVIMGAILLLIGLAGMMTLFWAHAYRTARTSLTRIKAFSDHLVENMPIGLAAVDAKGLIVSFNQAAESVLRHRAPEVLGREASEVLPGKLLALTRRLEGERGIIEEEIDCPVEGGRTVPMDVSVSQLQVEDGAYGGYLVLFRDLSEVRELKEEVERSRRLASLGRLAAGIAHEIRNPLSSIKGFATYFKERYRDNPDDQNTAGIMIQEVDRLNRVIGQLLEFARPMTVERRPYPIQQIIQHGLKMIEREAGEKGISIRTDLDPDIREVSVDPDRINQVLLNLFLNAMEAMEGGGTLSVSLFRDAEGQGVKIAVSDTGRGIGREELNHVFDPYFTTKQSGTGLGLAIVHRIIESHRGEARVESEPGKGTTVILFLPEAGTV